MVLLRTPFGRSVVDVPDALVDRYAGAGWVGTEAAGSERGAPKGNASREAWATYADALGVEYAEDAKRDDIKDAVSASQSK